MRRVVDLERRVGELERAIRIGAGGNMNAPALRLVSRLCSCCAIPFAPPHPRAQLCRVCWRWNRAARYVRVAALLLGKDRAA